MGRSTVRRPVLTDKALSGIADALARVTAEPPTYDDAEHRRIASEYEAALRFVAQYVTWQRQRRGANVHPTPTEAAQH